MMPRPRPIASLCVPEASAMRGRLAAGVVMMSSCTKAAVWNTSTAQARSTPRRNRRSFAASAAKCANQRQRTHAAAGRDRLTGHRIGDVFAGGSHHQVNMPA